MKIMVDVVLNHAGYGMKPGDTKDTLGTTRPVENFPTEEEQSAFDNMLREHGGTDSVMGELSNLPDFITEDPEVRNQIIKWQVDWVEKLGVTPKGNTIDYYRIDTAKHVDKATLMAFKTALADAKSNFKYIVEAWENGDALDAYLNNGLTDSVLNFDFNDIISAFAQGKIDEAETKLEALNDKATSAAMYGNFLSSHDEDGFMYLLGEEKANEVKKAIYY